jgi:hypothetical protein
MFFSLPHPRRRLSPKRIVTQWDGMLRLAGSLLLGRVPATAIMFTLQVGDNPARLAQAIGESGRIDKTSHSLKYIEAALKELQREGCPVRDEDKARLSPLAHDHLDMLGRYSLTVAVAVARGELRALRNPPNEPEQVCGNMAIAYAGLASGCRSAPGQASRI